MLEGDGACLEISVKISRCTYVKFGIEMKQLSRAALKVKAVCSR